MVKVEGVELSSLSVVGVLCITNAGLVFRSDKTHLRVFHGMVAKADTKRKKKAGGSAFGHELTLQIDCKVRCFCFLCCFFSETYPGFGIVHFWSPKTNTKKLARDTVDAGVPS